ncbi:hypothetical protein F7D08_0553 [Bifidobacterium cebidarum]|uniref:Uncharacterized protein n=2 Tax=Bifidobacterium cebidarum TaxID=2650773 RepID=A0A6I1GHF7_9BIFI|nr:hypothetical protein F7D08_0553 [Bifidobacterium cebidarum]
MNTGNGAWFEGRAGAAREAWNRVRPASGIASMLLFFACWVIMVAVSWVIPYTHAFFADFEHHKFEAAILAAVTFVLSRSAANLMVLWHRGHMPDGLLGIETALFDPMGYEIVGGDDHSAPNDDSMSPRYVAYSVKTLLFCPVAWDRRVDVLAYPAGSEVGARGKAQEITLLISGTRVRLEGPALGEQLNPRPQYRENGEYLLVADESSSAQSAM